MEKETQNPTRRLPKVEEYRDKKGDHRIRVRAANGNILTATTEGYRNKSECIRAAIQSAKTILRNYHPELLNDPAEPQS